MVLLVTILTHMRHGWSCHACETPQTICSLVNTLLRSPLRRFPGPLLAKLSPAYLFVIELAGQRAFWVHSQHQHYGPVVRIAPNELSFATVDAAKDIYLGVEVGTSSSQHKPDAVSSKHILHHMYYHRDAG
jgi:hypothetical protein